MSTISSVYASAMSGLHAATDRLSVSATEAALAPVDRVTLSPEARAGRADLIQATADRITASSAFSANLKTMNAAQTIDAALLGLFT